MSSLVMHTASETIRELYYESLSIQHVLLSYRGDYGDMTGLFFFCVPHLLCAVVQKPASNGCMAELELWREKHSELSSLVEQFKLPTGRFLRGRGPVGDGYEWTRHWPYQSAAFRQRYVLIFRLYQRLVFLRCYTMLDPRADKSIPNGMSKSKSVSSYDSHVWLLDTRTQSFQYYGNVLVVGNGWVERGIYQWICIIISTYCP